MMGRVGKLLVLVNGLPGAGKSTVGQALAQVSGARFLSKDMVKEALATCVEDPAGLPDLGGIAMDAVWSLARTIPTSVVIDSWWFAPRDREFARAGIEKVGADRAVEVWCHVPAHVAKARYTQRCRADFFHDSERLTTQWDIWAEQATPLHLAPIVIVDTTAPVDYPDLIERIERATDDAHPQPASNPSLPQSH
ncbi:AAA family ATPase [Nocardia sp. BSTN01]|uniref:AAA family ATPase n=1 Tax=Nocardia sp. BSTN01 TaxID=2783665 RepID=UPI0018903E09|nr:AAA family ATPase [Nocardia sp. BSTN01]MBF5002390.1 AAA family ATPase [Nocardia sp. BSTN01]